MKLSLLVLNYIFSIFLLLLFFTALMGIDPALSKFIENYLTFFVLIFLMSLAIIIYHQSSKLIKLKKEQVLLKNYQRDFSRTIKQLSYDEKCLLSFFLNEQKTERAFDPKNPSIQLLEAQKIIFNTAIVEGTKKIYRIDAQIYQLIKSNPNLLY